MISQHRKNEIVRLAEFIAGDFFENNITALGQIAEDEDVFVYYDDYENAFDGMLLYDHADFHIHINTGTYNSANSKRVRFTFGHELGHYYIEEHRLGLKYGLLEPHASFHNINQKNLMELEADYFASCLLMPQKKFRDISGGKTFSFQTVLNLSESFQVSVIAALIRFSQIGTHEIFAVISENGIAKWFVKSSDFPDWPAKFKVGKVLPQTSIANQFFVANVKYNNQQELSADDWFYPFVNDTRVNRTLYEQCHYSDKYGYVISLLWFD